MEFYVVWSFSERFDPESSHNKLGTVSFKQFWVDDGYAVLINMINFGSLEDLDQVNIIDSNKKKYSVEEFLDEIKKYKIIDS